MSPHKIEWISKGENNTRPEIKFYSPINVDDGYVNHPQGEFESTMELFGDDPQKGLSIEWVVEDGEFVEHIGLWFSGKKLTDYDGVFELPIQAIKMLRGLGYIVPADEFDPNAPILFSHE